MAEIVFIAPNREVAELAKKLLGKGNSEFAVVVARMEEGVEAARRAVEGGARVLISRGFTYRMIGGALPHIPLVEVECSGYDILRAYLQAGQTGKRIAVVDSDRVTVGTASVEEILGLATNCIKVAIGGYRDYADGIKKAVAAGAECIIGNQEIAKQAEARGITGFVIGSGSEALQHAFLTARHLLTVEWLRDASVRQIETIINAVDYGILAIDHEGAIVAANSEAERIMGLAGPEAQVRESVSAKLRECMAGGERQLGVVEKIAADVEIVANYQAIVANGQVIGGVATLQELKHFQAVERQARAGLARRGHVAKHSFLHIETGSPAMNQVIAQAKRFAGYDATVLILGETGVGKEYFAHAIHLASSRKNGPFVAVNCAAIPENILESELFGYAEGAFTGAKKGGKVGLFEQAHGGTIFLDEIGEMSESLQARLLRVLQEREVYRVGDDRVVPVDIRVIAATNRNLAEMVRERRFREDLYYRLDVLTIEIPALRKRKTDIEAFVRQFIKEFNAQYRTVIKGVEPGGMEILMAYDWPGNIRQLHNIIGRLCVLATAPMISTADVETVLGSLVSTDPGKNDSRELRSVEVKAIRDALAQTGGNKQQAAKLLGIGRATLWRKMKELE